MEVKSEKIFLYACVYTFPSLRLLHSSHGFLHIYEFPEQKFLRAPVHIPVVMFTAKHMNTDANLSMFTWITSLC